MLACNIVIRIIIHFLLFVLKFKAVIAFHDNHCNMEAESLSLLGNLVALCPKLVFRMTMIMMTKMPLLCYLELNIKLKRLLVGPCIVLVASLMSNL